jgi:precorrin-3B C17-methyltransferase
MGSLTVVGLGPGSLAHLTPAAREAIEHARIVVGYKTYMELIRPLLGGKEVFSTGMRAEVERCRLAVQKASEGNHVVVVSSGDAGIYGMAGLVIEICKEKGLRVSPSQDTEHVDFHLEVIPGIPALSAGAALLGAPLMHDFASISLSDLLTPWETIKTHVQLAAKGDFVIILYNPKSHKRDWQLGAVRDILLKHRRPETPVGIVRRAAREGQSLTIATLRDLLDHDVDMQTIVIVGSSTTYAWGDYMVTPRGYLKKYDVQEGCENP